MEKPENNFEGRKVPESYFANKSKYKKTVSSNDTSKQQKSVFEVKETTDGCQLVAFSIDLMYNKLFPSVKLRGTGKLMAKCIFVAEQMKRKVRNLHQINTIETVQIKEMFAPEIESEGFYAFERVKVQTVFCITLMRQTPLGSKQAGYQKPLESKFVSTRDPRDYIWFVLEEKKVPKKKKLMAEKREEINNVPEKRDYDDEEEDNDKNQRYKRGEVGINSGVRRNNEFGDRRKTYEESRGDNWHDNRRSVRLSEAGNDRGRPFLQRHVEHDGREDNSNRVNNQYNQDQRDHRDQRDYRDQRNNHDQRDYHDQIYYQKNRDYNDQRLNQNNRDHRDQKDNQNNREHHDQRNDYNNRDNHGQSQRQQPYRGASDRPETAIGDRYKMDHVERHKQKHDQPVKRNSVKFAPGEESGYERKEEQSSQIQIQVSLQKMDLKEKPKHKSPEKKVSGEDKEIPEKELIGENKNVGGALLNKKFKKPHHEKRNEYQVVYVKKEE